MACRTWDSSAPWGGWCWATGCCVSCADVLSVQTELAGCASKAGTTSLQDGAFLEQHIIEWTQCSPFVSRCLLPDTDISTLFITYSHIHRWGRSCGEREKTSSSLTLQTSSFSHQAVPETPFPGFQCSSFHQELHSLLRFFRVMRLTTCTFLLLLAFLYNALLLWLTLLNYQLNRTSLYSTSHSRPVTHVCMNSARTFALQTAHKHVHTHAHTLVHISMIYSKPNLQCFLTSNPFSGSIGRSLPDLGFAVLFVHMFVFWLVSNITTVTTVTSQRSIDWF